MFKAVESDLGIGIGLARGKEEVNSGCSIPEQSSERADDAARSDGRGRCQIEELQEKDTYYQQKSEIHFVVWQSVEVGTRSNDDYWQLVG